MKAIVCEMCGSHDLIKQDGMYVCQNCGTKYTVEEAKKLMVEGVVDVTGSTVKVDNSSQINNLYELARRAKSSDNWEDAQNYYGQITQLDPSSWEAYFYSVYYRQLNCKIYQISSAASNISASIVPTFDLIKKNVPESEQKAAYSDVALHCALGAQMLKNGAYNHYSNNSQATGALGEYNQRGLSCANLLYNCACALEAHGQKELALTYYKKVNQPEYNRFFDQSAMDKITNNIKSLDSSYVPPAKASSGCYVATAVYGSYDCPEVWTLRRFRDYTLAKTWYGRAFIRTYYAISPTLVKWFGHTEWFKKMWRGQLDRMVKDLQDKGYESTPYEDRKW
ncbi:hypothetical protein SAMN05216349_102112 [Oribacterium sp. KHPX15]|uniref:TFIIB-type zinc finger domain-containing protein n=1 Tax=Oribacterium sp. KHPX15 TaxID=1855342 RepID=UPI00089731D9|nr:TFIIB-type zinc finger domain-containing protein [Oribacterium sp. KHPX15]SDZ88415.1 hypothetical protein SAMN05216349_102112 [Oribacterium sp. KHPX15]